MLKKQSMRLSREEEQGLREQLVKEVREFWSLKEVQELERCLREKTLQPLLRYLFRLSEVVDAGLRNAGSWDQYNFLRGQADVLWRVFRIPEELVYIKEKLEEAQKQDGV